MKRAPNRLEQGFSNSYLPSYHSYGLHSVTSDAQRRGTLVRLSSGGVRVCTCEGRSGHGLRTLPRR